MGKVKLTRGASAMRKWILSKKKMSRGEFARLSGVDRRDVARIIDGKRPRVGPDVADRIEKATGGDVKAVWFFEAAIHEVAA